MASYRRSQDRYQTNQGYPSDEDHYEPSQFEYQYHPNGQDCFQGGQDYRGGKGNQDRRSAKGNQDYRSGKGNQDRRGGKGGQDYPGGKGGQDYPGGKGGQDYPGGHEWSRSDHDYPGGYEWSRSSDHEWYQNGQQSSRAGNEWGQNDQQTSRAGNEWGQNDQQSSRAGHGTSSSWRDPLPPSGQAEALRRPLRDQLARRTATPVAAPIYRSDAGEARLPTELRGRVQQQPPVERRIDRETTRSEGLARDQMPPAFQYSDVADALRRLETRLPTELLGRTQQQQQQPPVDRRIDQDMFWREELDWESMTFAQRSEAANAYVRSRYPLAATDQDLH